MKPLLTILAATLLLTACSSGGLSAAQQTEALNTAVAQMLNQAGTDAALTVPTQQPTSAPVVAATTSSGPSNIPIPPEAACLPVGTDRVVGTVTDIWKGDEIEVEVNGQKVDVVYIGIGSDTGNPPMPMSADANSQMVLGKQVLLVRDVTDVDEYGRLPRYVISEAGVFVNYQLAKQGAAFPSSKPPDTSCDQTITQTQQ
jgi:endonuclease YncB( thermonuclease family)